MQYELYVSIIYNLPSALSSFMHSGVTVLYFWLGSKRRIGKRLFFSDDSYVVLIVILPASSVITSRCSCVTSQ